MFFTTDDAHTLFWKPEHLGMQWQKKVDIQLREDIEGRMLKQFGLVVAIIRWDRRGKGKIQDGTGFIICEVVFTAVVFRPFPGETMDGIVSIVNELGFFVEIGPMGSNRCFVSKQRIPAGYK
eukprot:Filipodium_phascolosomae@DN1892_c0_g1_i4.p1